MTEQLTGSRDPISNGRARDLIHALKVALLPFASRHAAMHRYYDSEPDRVPENVTVPREWLATAYEVLEEGEVL